MKREVELGILKELLRQLDEKVNIDAGVMYKNPTSVYTSTEVAQNEWQTLFRNHPQLIALSGSLPKPGSFMTVDDFGVPVLATRDPDGRFRAFVNACRHRGVRVAQEARGQQDHFVCPFHNWVYSNRGELSAIPVQDHFGEIDKSCHGLLELPAGERDGLLWVHPQVDGVIDLDSQLGGLAPEIASWGFGDGMVQMEETVIDRRLNWKFANDTFGETYHFNTLHRNTLANDFYGNVQMYDTYGRNHRMTLCMKAIDSLREKPQNEWNVPHAALPVYYLFPNVQLIVGGAGPTLVRVYADGPNPHKSFSQISFYIFPEVLESEFARALAARMKMSVSEMLGQRMESFASVIESEDYVAAASGHRGALSGAQEYMIFGRNEPALHHYHNTYRAALGMSPLEAVSEA